MTELPTQEPTEAPVVPPVAPAPVPVATPTPTVAAPTPSPHPEIFDPQTGKKWKDRFHGAQGARLQAEAQAAEKIGGFEQQIVVLQQTLGERDAEIAALNAQIAQLTEQGGQIPGLQEQIQQLSVQAMRADKYQMLMNHPELLALQVEQPGEGEDAEPVMVNPLLQLIETSNLPLDTLEQTIQQFKSALPLPATEVPPRPAAANPAVPPPAPQEGSGEPSGEDATWQAVQDAQEALNENPGNMQLQEAQRKAWQRYYEAQIPTS